MGKSSEDSLPSAPFYGDYEEFRRAYRTCFVYWLRTQAVEKDKKASAAAFSQLLVELAKGESSTDILEAFNKAYQAPLSSADMDKNALETRFLNWLPRGR